MEHHGGAVSFRTDDGIELPAATAGEMREVDRVAVEEFGLGVLQMMENAGRTLATHAAEMLSERAGRVAVLAGSGGNGGGGLCCARHLRNHGVSVDVVLDRPPSHLTGAAAEQFRVLAEAGAEPVPEEDVPRAIGGASVIVDALTGYGLVGAPRGRVAELIAFANRSSGRTLSLDVPSGVNATTGDALGETIRPERTLTLALPKTGLARVPGELHVADIGIPAEVYERLSIQVRPFFRGQYSVRVSFARSSDDD
jgi:NAD(P)H-hydrate epimerase